MGAGCTSPRLLRRKLHRRELNMTQRYLNDVEGDSCNGSPCPSLLMLTRQQKRWDLRAKRREESLLTYPPQSAEQADSK